MSVIGVVAEYNPFHYGHEHHLTETIRQLGTDCPVVCVMSGDFIQRGQAAVYSKFARAEAAISCGVDLVLELPLRNLQTSEQRSQPTRLGTWVTSGARWICFKI